MNIRKNDRFPLAIDGALHDGSGVGHKDGVAVFVPGAAVGDLVEVQIVKVEKRFLRGKLLRVIEPSRDRISPDCPAAGRCGGCAFAHLSYAAELRIKEQRVRDCFARLAGLEVPIRPIVPSPLSRRYRNKAQYPVAPGPDGRPIAGFYATRSHRVIPCGDCLLQPARASAAVEAVLEYMERAGVPAYDEQSCTGTVRHIFVREGAVSGQLCVMLVVRQAPIPQPKLLVELLRARLPGLVSVMLNINSRPGNAILGRECVTLWGAPYIEDTLCGLRFRISPLSFYQINHAQCEQLYRKAAEYAALTGGETLCDLYCGIGTIGLTMARDAGRVIGVEVVPEAVEDARRNAAENHIENAEFFCGTAGDLAAELAARGLRPDVCIIDPPRKGCDAGLTETLTRMSPRRIVYVSCDPATLARDAALLAAEGFVPAEVTPFDMFPRSAHVECAMLFTRERPSC